MQDEFLSAMNRAQNLRRFTWHLPAQANNREAMEVSYETKMKELAKACPQPEEIVGYEGRVVWKVVRGDELDGPCFVRTN